MQHLTRPRVAQILLVAVVGSLFLPWATAGGDSTAGMDFDEGPIVLFVAAAAIFLVQIGWRPAWIVSGFAAAILVRQILDVSDQVFVSVGFGLWVGLVLALVATAALVWEMFANIERAGGG